MRGHGIEYQEELERKNERAKWEIVWVRTGERESWRKMKHGYNNMREREKERDRKRYDERESKKDRM